MFHSVRPYFLALINLFFPPSIHHLVSRPVSLCPTATASWTTCPLFAHCGPSRFLLFFSLLFYCHPLSFFNYSLTPTHTKNTSLCVHGPFRLEIIECTVAPVAMEDSDHEVQSSSDEHDSCPTSPNRSRDHNADQVLATSFDLPLDTAPQPLAAWLLANLATTNGHSTTLAALLLLTSGHH